MTKEQQVILSLIRIALSGNSESIPEQVDWSKVIEEATEQGVLGICFESLEILKKGESPKVRGERAKDSHLSPNNSLTSHLSALTSFPDMDDLMDWIGQVEYMKSEYEHHTEVIRNLCCKLTDEKVLLLKGLGLSFYYPMPNHRPVGDIDIYTYGHHQKVDLFFTEQGLRPEQTVEKHTVLLYHGVNIENHSIYVDAYATKAEKKVQAFLETLDGDTRTDDGYYVPSPLKNYFFLLSHMARHFSEYPSITLRHLLDWGLFLNGEMQALRSQRTLIHDKLKEYGLLKCNDTFTALAQDVTGNDLSYFIFEDVSQKDKDRILENVFESKNYSAPKGLLSRTCYKLHLLFGNWWKYKYLAFSFWERIWYSMKLHVEHVEKI